MNLSWLCMPLCIFSYFFGLYLLLKDPKISITLPNKTEISLESTTQHGESSLKK
jgi:hypothetical protein